MNFCWKFLQLCSKAFVKRFMIEVGISWKVIPDLILKLRPSANN